jgi:hypothetical protein
MKILDHDIPVVSEVPMPDGTVMMVSSAQPGDVPFIDVKDTKVTSERKDGKVVITVASRVKIDYTELKKRIKEGRLTILDLERDG